MELTHPERRSVEQRILEIRKALVANHSACCLDLLAEMAALRAELDRDLQT